MENVMVRAWRIAELAAMKFGGKASQYIAGSLKQAWAEKKVLDRPVVEWELPADTRKTRTWLAAITGTHPVYKLQRSFLSEDSTNEYGEKVFRLRDGFYEANNGKRRVFIRVSNGDFSIVEQYEVLAAMAEVAAA